MKILFHYIVESAIILRAIQNLTKCLREMVLTSNASPFFLGEQSIEKLEEAFGIIRDYPITKEDYDQQLSNFLNYWAEVKKTIEATNSDWQQQNIAFLHGLNTRALQIQRYLEIKGEEQLLNATDSSDTEDMEQQEQIISEQTDWAEVSQYLLPQEPTEKIDNEIMSQEMGEQMGNEVQAQAPALENTNEKANSDEPIQLEEAESKIISENEPSTSGVQISPGEKETNNSVQKGTAIVNQTIANPVVANAAETGKFLLNFTAKPMTMAAKLKAEISEQERDLAQNRAELQKTNSNGIALHLESLPELYSFKTLIGFSWARLEVNKFKAFGLNSDLQDFRNLRAFCKKFIEDCAHRNIPVAVMI